MTTYAGALDNLIRLDYTSSQQVSDERSLSVKTALGGRRIAQLGAKSFRSWSVSVPRSSAGSVSRLQVLRQSQPMPWAWFPSWATRTNILTPEHTAWQGLSLANATLGSVVSLEGGGIAASLNDPTSPTRAFTIQYPVVADMPVSAGIHARPLTVGGSVTLRLTWVDAAGALLSSNSVSRVCVSSGAFTRIALSVTAPPAGAVKAYLVATGHSVLAGPSLSYTPAAVEWAVGSGCLSAVVNGLEQDVVTAFATVGGQESTYNFTVTEVG